MSKNALEFILAEYEKRGGLLEQFDFEFRNYLFLYAGPYFGYVCEKAEDGLEDYDTEHEYGWSSFEEFLDDTMTEVGMTFRKVLAALPAEAVYDLE